MLAIGADAHSTEHFEYLKLGVGVARRAWATPECVLNTRPLEEVRAWLAHSLAGSA